MIYLENILEISNTFFWYYIVIIMAIMAGLYFSIKSKFFNIRSVKDGLASLMNSKSEPAIGISPFKSFFMDLSSNLGAGNIIGIAIAISLGGPGAIFWMWIIAILVSSTSFIESTLSQIHKSRDNLNYSGGPSYYIQSGLNNRFIGIIYSLVLVLSVSLIFNSIQSNVIMFTIEKNFNIDNNITSVVLFLILSYTVFGGLQRISKIVSAILPLSMLLYMLIGCSILILNISEIPNLVYIVFKDAFDIKSIFGGGFGATIIYGIKSGLFLGKSGSGISPIISASSGTSHPVKQGLLHSLASLINTLLIGSISAFIILLSDMSLYSDLNALEIVESSFVYHFGSMGGLIMTFILSLFLFSSIISNYYCGECNILYLENSKQSLVIYRLVFLFTISFGVIPDTTLFWNVGSVGLAIMFVVNLFSVLILSRIPLNSLDDIKTEKYYEG